LAEQHDEQARDAPGSDIPPRHLSPVYATSPDEVIPAAITA
jgi:hypothetical protein